MPFPTTRWDELAKASLHGDAEARAALDQFCRSYWQPVNRFIQWKGFEEQEAADLTQDFFLNFLATNSLRRADRLRGKFRTFLLGALTHRLQKARSHQNRLKRGGGTAVASLDEVQTDENHELALPHVQPADTTQFDRAWAVRVLDAALAAVREDYGANGKQRLYERLKYFLTPHRAPPSYEETARLLEMNPGAAKTEIHRLRQAFRAALRLEISRTVSAPHEIEEELRYLRAVLSEGEPDLVRLGETCRAD